MTQYRIIVTPDAADDMVELRNYISEVLCAPNTALSYIRAVRKEIASLSEMPARYKPVDDEPWHSRGIRKFLVKNSFVYFRIDEEAGTVYILNIIYASRDQLRALSEMKLD